MLSEKAALTDADKLRLRQFVQQVTNRPRPLTAQPVQREGVFVWCDDWEIIELCKVLFHGKDAYLGDPPPNRLKLNPFYQPQRLIEQAEALWAEHGSAEALVKAFEARRTHA
jgi:hypothetical protein